MFIFTGRTLRTPSTLEQSAKTTDTAAKTSTTRSALTALPKNVVGQCTTSGVLEPSIPPKVKEKDEMSEISECEESASSAPK